MRTDEDKLNFDSSKVCHIGDKKISDTEVKFETMTI